MNVQKFFNKKLRNPKSAYGLGKLFSKTKPYSSRIGRRIKETPTLKKLLSIHKKVKSIENLLGGIGKLDAKIIGVQDKAEKDKKKDKKKEGKKKNKFLGGIIKPPKTGFLDAIRNFVTYTFLGWLFTFLQPHLDKMQFILPVIQTAFDVMIFILKNILGGIGNTLKAFYFVKDNLTGAVDKVKEAASGIQKTFDDTLVALQDVVNGTIEVVNSFIESTGEKFDKVETVDAGTIPPLPEVPKFDNNTSSFSAPPTQQPNTLPPGMSIQGAATGGRIDPSTPVTRGIQPEQRRDFRPLFKPSIQEQKSEPGKDVGGIDKVKDLYKSSTSGSGFSLGFFTISPTNEKDGFLALNKVSRELKINKSDDFLGLGNFMGASVDVALGQKPDKRTYQQFASGINYLVNYGINNPEAFQKMNLERMIETMVNSKVDVAINKIREEINKRSTTETPGTAPDGTTPGGGGGGAPSVESIDMSGISPEDVDALGRMIQAEAENQSAEGKASVMNAILNRYRLARAGKGYLPRGKTKDNVTIRDLLYAPSQFSPIGDGRFSRTSSADGKRALAQAISAGGNDPEKLKKLLMEKYKLSEEDANYVITSTAFSNPQGRDSVPFSTREVKVGNHAFQESPFARLSSPGTKIDANVRISQTEVSAVSRGFRTGLKTGPEGRIGAGSAYHIDARIIPELPLRDKVAMIDSMAAAHAQEGYVMEFSGTGVKGVKWNINASQKEKEELAKRVLSSHWAKREGWQPFDYFIVKTSEKDKTGQIVKGSNIMAPRIPGGTYEYQEGGGYGRHLIIRDKNGRIIFKVGHGDVGVPSPKEIGRRFKIDELPDAQKIAEGRRISPKSLTQLQDTIRDMSINDPPLSVPNVGRIVVKKNKDGTIIKEYFDSNNKPIDAKRFFELYKTSQQVSPRNKMKKGGLVYEQNNNPLFPPQTYASYNEPQMMAKVFIQPVIIEAPKSSTPSGIMFPSINLNSSKSPKLIKQ
jgi:spore germination cell wall hydrolase CwlJ-like protein